MKKMVQIRFSFWFGEWEPKPWIIFHDLFNDDHFLDAHMESDPIYVTMSSSISASIYPCCCFRTLMQGDKRAGFSIFFADNGLDTGPILLQKSTYVSSDDNVDSIYNRFLYPEGIRSMVSPAGSEWGCHGLVLNWIFWDYLQYCTVFVFVLFYFLLK